MKRKTTPHRMSSAHPAPPPVSQRPPLPPPPRTPPPRTEQAPTTGVGAQVHPLSAPSKPIFLDGNSVVRVRAQVMMRDDSTGGWVPMGGGGLANVSVRKRKIHHEDDQPCKHEYLIHGKRISDQSIVLSCTIKKDFEYNKVMPTFHHWKTGNKKFGLTFQTAADARAFDKGVRLAIEDLLDGISETSPLHQFNLDVGDDDVFMQLDLPVGKGSSELSRTSPPNSDPFSGHHSPSLLGQLKASTTPPSTNRLGGGGGSFKGRGEGGPKITDWSSAAEQQQLHHERKLLLPPHEQEELQRGKDYSYVKFPPRHFQVPSLAAASHEYSYPKLVDTLAGREGSFVSGGDWHSRDSSDSSRSLKKPPPPLCDSMPSLKKGLYYPASIPPTLSQSDKSSSGLTASLRGLGSRSSPSGSGSSERGSLEGGKKGSSSRGGTPSLHQHKFTCAHCRESFSSEDNPPGSCHYAPDCLRQGIETITCLQCAKCLLYHCLSDSEGDYVHPCECSNSDGHRTRRWIGLSLLSILVPCLCCFVPLMACYRCGTLCKICGGKHQPAPPNSSSSS
eukprot:maker-scaffold693_size110418-snap-gene-0.20 protein:Tk06970 transcript:maker-scaffold693_size110418-snap-gene-0.20-mRNA-1 annotation:"low quality protein: sprouty- evh1 domain-containing protein 2-like"